MCFIAKVVCGLAALTFWKVCISHYVSTEDAGLFYFNCLVTCVNPGLY